uniref:Carbamoyltransferase n=1 Tax=uncultured Helicobacter sp. TaxID=175537 RepID=A0A650EL15_9HELI|nr:carbamoyltransferase [uncultured Helicobacter sp.]
MKIFQIELFGIIQGVGFRPFVYTLAHQWGLKGYVQNRYSKLLIILVVENEQILESFLQELFQNIPKNASIHTSKIQEITQKNEILSIQQNLRESFYILGSPTGDDELQPTSLPYDTRICEQCLKEMLEEKGRFAHYAFTTCAHCGVRYSILKHLPYDRIHTSMSAFQMCPQCQESYNNPFDRRFHAQPNSCLQCAIRLRLFDENDCIVTFPAPSEDDKLITQVAQMLKKGKIVAMKGVGGFNLIADASNQEAIKTLRQRKNRPFKPFAVMFKSLEQIQSIASVSALESEALLSPAAPIVLLEKLRQNHTSQVLTQECLELLAPQVSTIGAILPYNGLMYLLFEKLTSPLIFTSANIPHESIIADVDILRNKLGREGQKVYDVILDYNREIVNPIDDSIVRLIAGKMRPLRLARGFAPKSLRQISSKNQHHTQNCERSYTILALGAHQKASLTFLACDDKKAFSEALISAYIGDLESKDSIERYYHTYTFLSHFYARNTGFKPRIVACDANPRYVSTQIAKEIAKAADSDILPLAHHKAHFYAILGEYEALSQRALGIVWDGTGLGEDGHIWGGEAFIYNPSNPCFNKDSLVDNKMERVAHFEEFALLGGESATKEIAKVALSLIWSFVPYTDSYLYLFEKTFTPQALNLLRHSFDKKLDLPTSSVGRLFDGVAYLLGILSRQSYEGQSGAMIESLALEHLYRHSDCESPYEFCIHQGVISLKGIVCGVIGDMLAGEILKACDRFLETLAHIALSLSQEFKTENVYFSGGVFQNKLLCDKIHRLFSQNHIAYQMHTILPTNDANISFGQAIYTREILKER